VGTVDPRAAVGQVWVQLSSPMQDSGLQTDSSFSTNLSSRRAASWEEGLELAVVVLLHRAMKCFPNFSSCPNVCVIMQRARDP